MHRDSDTPGNASKEDDELFWAICGGSPGNFGVLTHIIVRPFHDDDYPDSRAMKSYCIYTKERNEACLKVLAEMSDDPDLPRNFDCCITDMTDWNNTPNGFLSRNAKAKKEGISTDDVLSLDEKMLLYYPEQYSDGPAWAESGQTRIPYRQV